MNNDIHVSGKGFSYWIDILSKKVCATDDGIYLVYCKEDAGSAYHLYRLKKGDNFFDIFGPKDQGQWISELIAFKPIPDFCLDNNNWKKIEPEENSPFIKMPYSGLYIVAYRTTSCNEVNYMLSGGKKGDDLLHEYFDWDPTWNPDHPTLLDVINSDFLENKPGFEILGVYYTFTFSKEMEAKHYKFLKEELVVRDYDKTADERLIDNLFFALW